MISELLDLFAGRGNKLFSFESHMIDRVAKELRTEASVLLHRQVAAVNKVQRLSAGKEVNLYVMRRGKALFDEGLRFANIAPERSWQQSDSSARGVPGS